MEDLKLKRLAVLMYAVGGLVVVDQIADWLLTVGSSLGQGGLQIRYLAISTGSARLSALVMGDALLFLAAFLQGHRLAARVWGALHFAFGGLALAATVVFILDVLQLRAGIAPEALTGFSVVAAKTATMIGLAGLLALAVGISSFTVPRLPSHQSPPIMVSDRPGNVVAR